jgi:hypothetical protein
VTVVIWAYRPGSVLRPGLRMGLALPNGRMPGLKGRKNPARGKRMASATASPWVKDGVGSTEWVDVRPERPKESSPGQAGAESHGVALGR